MTRQLSAALSRRRLRSALRDLRIRAYETQRQVAESLDWSPAKVLRIEAGQVGITMTDLRALLMHYKADDRQINELIGLARLAKANPASYEFRDILTRSFLEFLEHEEAAPTIRQVSSTLIPEPLQTVDYARCELKAVAGPEVVEGLIDRQVQARLSRQELLLSDNGPQATYILGEFALRLQVGAESDHRDVMTRQLGHLVEIGARPNVNIQVVPFRVGLYRAMRETFTVLEFEDAQDPNLLCRESSDGEMLLDDNPMIVAQYLDMFAEAERLGSKPQQLGEVVESLLNELDR